MSPLTVKLKSLIDALSLNTGAAFEKSSESILGLIWVWSMKLMLGGSEPLSAFINDAFAESSGRSPVRVMSLPLRMIESAANDIFGAPDLLEVATVDDALLGALPERGSPNAP